MIKKIKLQIADINKKSSNIILCIFMYVYL